MNEKKQPTEETTKKSDTKADLLIFISIIIVVIMATLLLLSGRITPASTPAEASAISSTEALPSDLVQSGDIPNMSPDELRKLIRSRQDSSMFTVQVNAQGTIKRGDKRLSLMVANAKSNTKDCRFDLLIGGEVFYSSPALKPQSYIDTETLKTALEPGNYVALVRYYILDANGNKTGVAEVEVKIICK